MSAAAAASLQARQRALAELIRAEDEPEGAPVRALLRPLAGVPPRLSIYRHAFRGRLTEALRANYPVLHRVLGDEAFAELALAYLGEHPSRQPSIRWFGHALADWLDARLRRSPDALPHPALPDLARMEWAVGLSFDAADAVALAHESLAAVPPADWPALRFAPHPSVRRIDLAWGVEPLWRALTDDPEATTTAPEPQAHSLLVWRQGLDSRWRSLPAGEAAALATCLAGARFDALCEALAARPAAADEAPDPAARAALWLAQWVAAGLLVGVGDEPA